jgi:hypothetical protein
MIRRTGAGKGRSSKGCRGAELGQDVLRSALVLWLSGQYLNQPLQHVQLGRGLNQIYLTHIDFRGDGWYTKLKLNEETSLKDGLVKGEVQRGNCSLMSKAQRRISERKD